MLCWAILYLCLQARIPIKDQERIGTETTPKVPVKGEEGVTQPGLVSQLFESVRRLLFYEEKAVDDKTVQEFIRSVCKTNKESDFLRLRTALNGFTSENAHTSAKAFLRMLKEHPKDDSIANIVAEQSCQIIKYKRGGIPAILSNFFHFEDNQGLGPLSQKAKFILFSFLGFFVATLFNIFVHFLNLANF
eukprot:GEMP01084077.1.p1 GENE.GEMP01084077.1~~GEMP01084077.1.p1  ORF type:complete len:190 (+),score=2.99 GEMP01084077.1:428-997(+)